MIRDLSFSDPGHGDAERTLSFTYDRLGRMLAAGEAATRVKAASARTVGQVAKPVLRR